MMRHVAVTCLKSQTMIARSISSAFRLEARFEAPEDAAIVFEVCEIILILSL